ncbi:MAG: VCBS repeat-containing protein [Bacteroidia bacterium]|nr:VCBS repeat-containing protein [Bacteroidia bacterium]
MKKSVVLLFGMCLIMTIKAQPWFNRVDSVPVRIGSTDVLFPWAGGLNYCQFSQIDLNQDGIKDLFVFDRTGFKVSTFINKGTSNAVDYVFAPQYRDKFPAFEEWVLLADYNCDGKEDIFAYTNGGMKVYRNDSDLGNGLKFTLITPLLLSHYHPNNYNLYVSSVDIPAISDIDGDGDLDIVTMSIMGTFMEYHQNKSKEIKGNCDTLAFELATTCWGNFAENSFDNKVNLNLSCKVKEYAPDQKPPHLLHSGSCQVCLDIDGDGDKEIVIGGISATNLTLVVNGGTPTSAKMTSQDAAYPPSSPVNMTIFPCAFYLDVDNDGLNDMLVSPNAANASENFTSVLLYKNTGSTNSVTFTFQKNSFLQDEMIDVGEGAYPVFFDYNGDGLKDLLVGNYKYYTSSTLQSKMALFKNTGTITKPSFELVTRDYANLGPLNIINMIPAFGDLDGDGDLDMIIGDSFGKLYYFTNTPVAGVASFALTTSSVKDNAGTIIDVGGYAAPQLIDVDRDSKLDIIIGSSSGKLAYYRNTGTVNSPVFTKISVAFGGVDVVRKSTYSITGYSVPYMYDAGGTYKLLIGSESGYLYYYNNIDGNLSGNFTLVDSSYQKVWEGSRIAPGGTDINNDGLVDLAIGNYAGGVSLLYGQTTNSVKNIGQQQIEFDLYPNPASDKLTIYLSLGKGMVTISIIDIFGREVKQFRSNESIFNADVSFLTGGLYICRLQFEDTNGRPVFGSKRFVIAH